MRPGREGEFRMATVCFVDDEPAFLESYDRRLRDEGHAVLHAQTVAEARKILAAHAIDLVVLDIMLPYEPLEDLLRLSPQELEEAVERDVWSGIRLFQTLRSEHPDVRVVIFSVLPETEIRSQSPDTTFDCPFLRKGEDDPEFVHDTLNRALTGR